MAPYDRLIYGVGVGVGVGWGGVGGDGVSIVFTPSVCLSIYQSVCHACSVRFVTFTVEDGFFLWHKITSMIGCVTHNDPWF